MDVEPVAWIVHARTGDQLTTDGDYVANAEGILGLHSTPLYAAPPALVSPEVLPCPVVLEPGMRFGKGVRTQTMLDALQRRAEFYAELEVMTPEQRGEYDADMREFAAMLQAGNSPVIPDGYVIVPVEQTEAMMLHKSGCQHHSWDDPDCSMRQTRRLIWSHMLASALEQ